MRITSTLVKPIKKLVTYFFFLKGEKETIASVFRSDLDEHEITKILETIKRYPQIRTQMSLSSIGGTRYNINPSDRGTLTVSGLKEITVIFKVF